MSGTRYEHNFVHSLKLQKLCLRTTLSLLCLAYKYIINFVTGLDFDIKPHENLLVKYLPSSSRILMVVLLFGSNRIFLSVAYINSSNCSVGSNEMTSSVILKVMSFSVSLVPKVIVWFISSPCISVKRE